MKGLMLAAVFAIPQADARPVWDQFQRIVCVATATTTCTAASCSSTPPKASFEIDFEAGTAKSVAGKDTVKIIHRYYVPPMGKLISAKSSITTSENDLFNLQETTIGADGKPVMRAVRVTAYDNKTLTMWLVCHPS
jgi:hypothetical protein